MIFGEDLNVQIISRINFVQACKHFGWEKVKVVNVRKVQYVTTFYFWLTDNIR